MKLRKAGIRFYLMECNHLASQKRGKYPVCQRCNCTKIVKEIKSVTDGLEGRLAKCKRKSVKSRWDLPGFVYQPDKDFDLYLYGR